jgi:ribA/ribD-fused uncharacterized protein
MASSIGPSKGRKAASETKPSHKAASETKSPPKIGPSKPRDSRVTLFYSGTPFSNWYPSSFILNEVKYTSVEQAMMHGKALLFKDETSARGIMRTTEPRKQKALGRKVRGYDEEVWVANRERIVKDAVRAKFTQNRAIRDELLATRGTLAEASPGDKIWGIGMSEDDPDATNPTKWTGLNLLGKILTEVRDELKTPSGERKRSD